MKKTILMMMILASGTVISCRQTEPADLIVKNARIYSVDKEFTIVESFAVRDGIFLMAGTNEEIATRFSSDNVLDLGGKAVYPGFYDAHCHFVSYSNSLRRADLVGTGSFEEVCNVLVEHQEQFPSEWALEGDGTKMTGRRKNFLTGACLTGFSRTSRFTWCASTGMLRLSIRQQ